MTATSFGSAGLVNTQLNINQPMVLKASAGGMLTVNVTVAGSTAGAIYDSPTTGGNGTGSLIATLPNTVGPINISFPCQTGITVVPGSGQCVSAVYQ
jgi:hypothetical protein